MSRLRQIGVFAKHWTPGEVKTRLAEDVGREAAAEVARLCLAVLLGRLARIDCRRVLGFTPAERAPEFAQLADRYAEPESWILWPQTSGDLGRRMGDYFDAGFQAGAQRVLLLGADCPTLPRAHVTEALESLEGHDVAIGPAEDGGYCLIAARQPTPWPLFEPLPWGGGQVLDETLERARRTGLRVHQLQPWPDVDRVEDLPRLLAQLEAMLPETVSRADTAPHTEQAASPALLGLHQVVTAAIARWSRDE